MKEAVVLKDSRLLAIRAQVRAVWCGLPCRMVLQTLPSCDDCAAMRRYHPVLKALEM